MCEPCGEVVTLFVVANQLHIYLETTGLLQETQSGFRKHHSCQTALINSVGLRSTIPNGHRFCTNDTLINENVKGDRFFKLFVA